MTDLLCRAQPFIKLPWPQYILPKSLASAAEYNSSLIGQLGLNSRPFRLQSFNPATAL
jgi:hypothetical protein